MNFERSAGIERLTVQQLLDQARQSLTRLSPQEVSDALPAGAVVLDSRTPTDRERFGCIPGSVHAPRTLLEFMIEPNWGYQHESIVGFGQLLIVVCNGGFSSSLAAASLQSLGFSRATDMEGGMLAWVALGLPIEPPPYQRLD